MMEVIDRDATESHEQRVENYYRMHSYIYDLTRWSFLFGRETILHTIPDLPSQPRILEVGCGTGKNIQHLSYHFPDAEILGLDLSEDMLEVARSKVDQSQQVEFRHHKYGTEILDQPAFDLVLLSYSLTMIGDEVEDVLNHIYSDLKSDGYIAVVDFNTTPFKWFQRWMGVNHVDLSGRSLPLLKKYFRPQHCEIHNAYFGLWSYFLFLGKAS